jgi:hypothetical protein
MHFGYMNVILLYSNHQHVSATRVDFFRVISARIQIYIYIYTVGQDNSTVNNHIFWLKFRLNG